MSEFTVVWAKRWSDRPIADPKICHHDGASALSINQRLEPKKRGGFAVVLDGSICMDCGIDVTGQLNLRDGLALCWEEHSWNYETRQRLYDLARRHERELFEGNERLPLWMAYAWDWPTERIIASLNEAAAEDAEDAAAHDASAAALGGRSAASL